MIDLAHSRYWILGKLARAFRPRQRLSVSEWSDAHRMLSGKSSAESGAWRTSRTPYLREILDCLSDESPIQRVVVMKSAQIGLTEAGLNWIGYVMDHVRTSKPMLVVLPTLQLRVEWVRQRLDPMLEAVPALKRLVNVTRARDGANREDMKDYAGGVLMIATAGSASSLKSKPIRYVLGDEIDEFDWDVSGRGDPMGLIESRTANFPRRKLFLISTPTIKGASRVEAEYERSDRRRYQVPCPHCGEYQVLEWAHLQWTRDVGKVWYVCRHNGCVIDEHEKPGLLSAGRWVADHPGSPIRGYHLNALYSPVGLGYNWRELVYQWLHAQTDPLRLKQFLNERLGQTWEDLRSAIKPGSLQHRAEDYRLREIPRGALILTAGVDTQDDRLAVQVVGWGANKRWWILDWIELPGDPAREEVWDALADRLNRPLQNAFGHAIYIKATAIDQGGHHTEDVKAFARSRKMRHLVVSVVGDNVKSHSILGPQRYVDFNWRGHYIKNGSVYHRVGTEKAKDRLYSTLKGDENQAPEERHAHFSIELPPEYYSGLLSEIWDPQRNRYRKKPGRPNEPLDTWVYAYAAAHHPLIDLQRKRKIDWEALAAQYEVPLADATATPEPSATTPPARTRRPAQRERPIGSDDWSSRI